MSLWDWLMQPMFPGTIGGAGSSPEPTSVNPTTGLPMIGGIGGVDVGGNIYGSSAHSHIDNQYASPSWTQDWHAHHNPGHIGSGSIGGYDPVRGW